MPDVAHGFPDMLDVLQASSPQIEERTLPHREAPQAEGSDGKFLFISSRFRH